MAAVAVVAVWAAPVRASATACTFKNVGPIAKAPPVFGITYSHWSIACPNLKPTTAVVARIDTHETSISFDATPPRNAGSYVQETTSQFVSRTGAQLAVNANLFATCCSYAAPGDAWQGLNGWAVSGGKQISKIGNDASCANLPFDASLIIAGKTVKVVTLETGEQPPPNTQVAVTGSHRLLRAGVVADLPTPQTEFFGPNARTGAGVSGDGRYLWLVVVDGHYFGADDPRNFGVNLPNEADLLKTLGAMDAINLDGGGSSTMSVEGGALNTPSDGATGCTVPVGRDGKCERYVGLNFGVHGRLIPPTK